MKNLPRWFVLYGWLPVTAAFAADVPTFQSGEYEVTTSFGEQPDDVQKGVLDPICGLVRVATRGFQRAWLRIGKRRAERRRVQLHIGLFDRRKRHPGGDEVERNELRVGRRNSAADCRLHADDLDQRQRQTNRRLSPRVIPFAKRAGCAAAVRLDGDSPQCCADSRCRVCRSARTTGLRADGARVRPRNAELARTLQPCMQAAVHDVTLSPLVGTSCVLSPQASCLPPSRFRCLSMETTMHKLGITDASFLYMESPAIR